MLWDLFNYRRILCSNSRSNIHTHRFSFFFLNTHETTCTFQNVPYRPLIIADRTFVINYSVHSCWEIIQMGYKVVPLLFIRCTLVAPRTLCHIIIVMYSSTACLNSRLICVNGRAEVTGANKIFHVLHRVANKKVKLEISVRPHVFFMAPL